MTGEAGTAVVIGASGGLGCAFTREIVRRGGFDPVVAASRSGAGIEGADPFKVDVTDEVSLARLAQSLRAASPLRLILVATGLLSEPGLAPERSYRALQVEQLLRLYTVNAIGPAMVAKHLLPLLPRRGRSVFAALSARVGSIGDDRLGGWHGYRASKAALNMMLRNLSIELARTHPEAVVVGLHPGTVDTGLSRPFQSGVRPEKLFTPDFAADRLLTMIDALRPEDSGAVFAWDGSQIPF